MRKVLALLLISAVLAGAGGSSAQVPSWHACSEGRLRISGLQVVNETCATARAVMRAWLRTDACQKVNGPAESCFVTQQSRQWECLLTRRSARYRQFNCVSETPRLGPKRKMVNFKVRKA